MDRRTIALVCYANARLGGRTDVAFPRNAVASPGETFRFRSKSADTNADGPFEVVAHSAEDWVDGLARRGARSCALALASTDDAWSRGWMMNGIYWAIDVDVPASGKERWISWSDLITTAPQNAWPHAVLKPKTWLGRWLARSIIGSGEPELPRERWHDMIAARIAELIVLPINLVILIASLAGWLTSPFTGTPRPGLSTSHWQWNFDEIGTAPEIASVTLDDARVRLKAALNDAAEIARQCGADAIADANLAAFAMLQSGAQPVPACRFVPSGTLPTEAITLLAACDTAWRFAGQDSWNDLDLALLGNEGKARYHAVSNRLFRALVDAMTAATDCSANC